MGNSTESSYETGTKSFTIKNEKGLPVPSDQIKSNTFSEENQIEGKDEDKSIDPGRSNMRVSLHDRESELMKVMRGEQGSVSNDDYDIYVFQEGDKNPYRVWLRFKNAGKVNISFDEFKKMNNHLDFTKIGVGTKLRFPKGTLSQSKKKDGKEYAGNLEGKKKVLIAWSFDDGPYQDLPKTKRPDGTEALKERIGINNVTWFIVKSNMLTRAGGWQENIKRYKQIQKNGGEIGIHAQHDSIDHIVWFPAPQGAGIYKCYSSIEKAIDDLQNFKRDLEKNEIYPKFVRLPGGLYSQLQYYTYEKGFRYAKNRGEALNHPKLKRVIKGVMQGESFEIVSKAIDIPQAEQPRLNAGYEKLVKDYAYFKSSLKSMNLLIWGGSSDPNEISKMSWQAESSGSTGTHDTITKSVTHKEKRGGKKYVDLYAGKFEKLVSSMSEGETRSLVILAHDTRDYHIDAIEEDKKVMEDYASKHNTIIEYVTMSNLFNEVTGEDIKTFKSDY